MKKPFYFIIFSFHAPVAQQDRAADYESAGWGFKSLRARLDKDTIDRIFKEEYETFSRIYRLIAKRDLPLPTLDDLVEECFLASHEEIIKSTDRSILRAFALSVAARIIQRIKKEVDK